MILTIFLEKPVVSVEEGTQFTDAVKRKVAAYPDVKVSATCTEPIIIEEPQP